MSVLGTGPFKRQKQTHSSKWIVGRVEDDNLYGDITSIDQDYTDISSLNCSDIFDEGSDYALSAVGDCNIRKRCMFRLPLELIALTPSCSHRVLGFGSLTHERVSSKRFFRRHNSH